MAEAMDWAEIKMRLRDGASVQVLADLNAVTYKTMYNRIMAHQVKDGVEYLTPRNTKGMQKSKAISKTKQAQAKAKEKKAAQKSAERPEEKQDIPEEVYTGVRDLMPETIEEINNMYYTCKQLAERYQKQAEDWRRIMEACASWANAKEGCPLPEVDI